MKHWYILIAMAITGLFGERAFSATADNQFGVGGYLQVILVDFQDGATLSNETITHPFVNQSGVSQIADSAMLMGNETHTAKSAYFADLSRGYLGAFQEVFVPFNRVVDDRFTGSVGEAQGSVGAWDTLTVTLPAGSYPDGAYGRLSGTIHGHIDLLGDQGMQGGASWQVLVNNSASSINVGTGLLQGEAAYVFAQPFTIEVPLAQPGALLASALDIPVQVSANLGYRQTNMAAVYSQSSGLARTDFLNSLIFNTFTVPDGATWTSASGVFLSNPVPIPGAAWLFASAMAGIGLFVRARKAK